MLSENLKLTKLRVGWISFKLFNHRSNNCQYKLIIQTRRWKADTCLYWNKSLKETIGVKLSECISKHWQNKKDRTQVLCHVSMH